MVLFTMFLYFLSAITEINADEVSKGGNYKGNHEKEKYTRNMNTRWQKYIDRIDNALMQYNECASDCYRHQRRNDFRFWVENGGIKKKDFIYAKNNRYGEHYQIINKTLYRQKECTFPARCSGNEYFILKVIEQLPDMDIIINSHDWPKASKWDHPLPVLSFSKTYNERDILYPAWSFWEGGPAVWPIYPQGLGRWDLMIKALDQSAQKWPWEKKLNKGFFRGSRTSAERDPLIIMSRDDPLLVDAQYTKNQAWRSNKDSLNAPPAKEIALKDHCDHKYLFNFRGVAASFRFKYLFLCKSLVFHVGDEWIEFFYSAMRPWVHYIPVSVDLKEVKELLEFAKENDEVVREIANRGHYFIAKHLRMVDVQNYWLKVLKRYGKLVKWTPEKDSSFVEIKKK